MASATALLACYGFGFASMDGGPSLRAWESTGKFDLGGNCTVAKACPSLP